MIHEENVKKENLKNEIESLEREEKSLKAANESLFLEVVTVTVFATAVIG